ncbi:ABC transporter ATP-binding protein [Bacillus sp. FJAT-50079]|uniref:ABC transporter ATP-binding protein n=1 Tax=Bacillus sp. FJAT-50079 TaxID=2833577 RepID=UPI001BC90678|nr:ABC transporter ATP-binding protein [Bacillus sp. FJAT-50079]MBS4209236.1 ABC transporter ATP-binding protein [Bacillus sp. FJAT-50079]
MGKMMEVKNISKKLKDFQLNQVSFDFQEGYIMGLIGPNGAGKSTLIRCLMDLMKVDQGEIKLFNLTHEEHTKEIKQRIGFVYDESHFYEDLTLEKNKRIIAPFYKNWDDQAFYQYIESFRLPLKKKVKHLSKGMKMKFAIAIALSHHPDLIILDEPTSGLDPVFRRELLDILQDFIQTEHKSVFFSTHITTDLEQIADYITFIHQGEIIFSKETDEILEDYKLVKGPKELAEQMDDYDLIGIKQTSVGFEALVKGNIVETEQLVFLQPNLEDIMYYTVKGSSK